jgi:putative peptide zinc metalloprotease protein
MDDRTSGATSPEDTTTADAVEDRRGDETVEEATGAGRNGSAADEAELDAGHADDDALLDDPDADADLVFDDLAADDADADVDEWGGLRPLDDDDLAALDPSALEDDIDLDEDLRIDEPHEPPPPSEPASPRRADDLTAGAVLRPSSRAPQGGWRRLVHQLTGGAISPRASRGEQERVEQLSVIRTLVTHPRRITVLSRKGGVGKTTTTLMLGQVLASERGDRIIAVDGNPDAGSLGYRVAARDDSATVTDLLNEFEGIHRYADMRRFTVQTQVGLEVLRSDDDPQISTALGDQEYGAIMSLLDRFYNLILLDTGTGILDSAVQGILDGTDQIVLVVSPSLDAARAASQTLDWLTEHGFVELVENAVTVINQTRRSSLVDISRIEDHFWDRCGATVRVPWDSYLEAGAETDLADLRPATLEAYRHLAAAVARRFHT